MEARAVGVGNDVGNIVPFENIPVDQLSKHYNDLANKHQIALERLQAITNLYTTATDEIAIMENSLNDNMDGEVKFAEGFEGAYEAATKKNALLEMEITHLKNQKVEITNGADENAKSAQECIVELGKVIELQKTDIEKFISNEDIVVKFLDKDIELWRGHIAYEIRTGGDLVAYYTTKFLNERLEIRAKLLWK